MIRARYVVEPGPDAGWQVTDRAVPHARALVAWTADQGAALAIARAHEVQRLADLARVARLGGLDDPSLRAGRASR
jgi:hypothetical protein